MRKQTGLNLVQTISPKTKTAPGLDTLGRKVHLLDQLVRIDSSSSNIEGINMVQELIKDQLPFMNWELIKNPQVPSANLLVGTITGQSPRFITLVCHADTVRSSGGNGLVIKKNDFAEGAGIVDDKAGIVVALSGLYQFIGRGFSKYSIRLVVSPNEETGSIGFHDLFSEYATTSDIVLGFEPSLDDGSIISSRRGNSWYQVQVYGQEEHSGRTTNCKGNAGLELAKILVQMHELNNRKKGLTVNVGSIKGGNGQFNVKCGFAEAKVDCRFSDMAGATKIHKKIEKIFESAKLPVTFDIKDYCPAFMGSGLNPYVKSYVDYVSILENKTIVDRAGLGASDVNYFATANNTVIDGLGGIGSDLHCENESVWLPSLESRTQALVHLMQTIEKGEL